MAGASITKYLGNAGLMLGRFSHDLSRGNAHRR
jgi:hypothetical protein